MQRKEAHGAGAWERSGFFIQILKEKSYNSEARCESDLL